MNTIEYFMWGYQRHFQRSVKVAAEYLFKILDKKLAPKAFLIGVLSNEREDRHPICLEPDDCGYSPEMFSEVNDLANHLEAIDDEAQILHSHPIARERQEQRRKLDALRQAIEKILYRRDEYQGVASFCSLPVRVDDYLVSIVLQLDRGAYSSHYSLTKDKADGRYPISTSLLNAAITEYLNACAKALQQPDAGMNAGVLERESEELIRAAGKRLMATPAWASSGVPMTDFFNSCNTIASLKYEGSEGIGKMIIARSDHPNVERVITFGTPVEMDNYRAARKMVELSKDDLHLLATDDSIYGLGRLVGRYDTRAEDLFLIIFNKHLDWTLSHAGHELMRVVYGQPRLPEKSINEEKFKSDLKRIFKEVNSEDIERLWSLALAAVEQRHGTMLVVSGAASSEAARLAKQSTVIKPIQLTPQYTQILTAIDGAVLVDPKGTCHAIGVILDGLASDKGTSARGARYNSAIRYVETSRAHFNHECIAIIVSEDGTIDLFPDLMPMIQRSAVEENLKKLREISEAEGGTGFKEYNRTMGWLKEHQFYLAPEVCEEINRLRDEIDARFADHGNVQIIHHDMVPNPEMNDSYFLD